MTTRSEPLDYVAVRHGCECCVYWLSGSQTPDADSLEQMEQLIVDGFDIRRVTRAEAKDMPMRKCEHRMARKRAIDEREPRQ